MRNNILITPRVKRVNIKACFHVMKIPHILNLFIVTFVSVSGLSKIINIWKLLKMITFGQTSLW